ncbi:NAD(P)H-dependent oxidoreductase [Burkholderia sp. Bp9002]|nr:NAD(P)H-dependent oxidoreductase [Burkholderia sp. Bp9002]
MIVGILGSGGNDSLCRLGLMVVAAQVRASGAQFDLVDLKQEFRDLHEPADYASPPPGSQTERLRRRVARASGIVLATPVYHGSFSGLLKNALDHLQVGAFRRRAVGLVTAGGGPRTANAAAEPLRGVVRALAGWATPTYVGLVAGDFGRDGLSDDVYRRIVAMVDELRFLGGMREADSTPGASRPPGERPC